jgi:hypothetical protein
MVANEFEQLAAERVGLVAVDPNRPTDTARRLSE